MKKVLALVLALVMTMGLATVGANAAFTDADSITYKEAAEVLNAIGVLEGNDSGAYDPAGSLDRASGAKIIAYMILGPTGAKALEVSKAPFSDVPASHWAAGPIAYCVSEGIISGKGDGSFGPAEPLTGYAFAKMALIALGYRADMEGLSGTTDWALNTARLIRKVGLSSGISAFAGSEKMTREQAAQMALNTLEGTEVYYDTSINNNSTGTTSTSTNTRTTNVTTTVANYDSSTANTTLQLVEDVFPNLKKSVSTDGFGRPTNKWVIGATVVSDATTRKPVATFTADLTSASNTEVVDALKGYTYDTTAIGDILNKNGTAIGVTTAKTKAQNDTAIKDATAQGRTIEVYANSSNAIDYVSAYDTYVAKVTNKDTANETVTLTLYKSGTSFTNTITSADSDADKDYYDALYALSKGDYVLLNVAGNPGTVGNDFVIIGIVGAPTAASGNYSKKSGSTYTIGGQGYKLAAYTPDTLLTLGNNYDLVLDQFDNVIAYAAASTTKNYALVLDTSTSGNVKDGMTYYANLLLADGTTVWAEVSKVGSTETSSSSYSAGKFNTDLPVPNNATGGAVSFVTYKEVDGKYELSALSDSNGTSAAYADFYGTGTQTITKNGATYFDGGQTYTLSNSTVFLFYNNSTKTYTAYNGIANLPKSTSIDATKTFVLQTASTTGGIARMIVATGGVNALTSDYVYVYDTDIADLYYNDDAASDNVVTLKAIVNGEMKTIDADSGITALYTASNGVQQFVKATAYDDAGFVTAAAAMTTGFTGSTSGYDVASATAATLNGASGIYYVFDSNAEFMKVSYDNGLLTFTDNAGAHGQTFITATECPIFVVNKTGDSDNHGAASLVEYDDKAVTFGSNTGSATSVYVKTNDDGYATWVLIAY